MAKKNGKAAVPAPVYVTRIVYVFSNGDVVTGTPQSLQIAQLEDQITVEARNIVGTEGDKLTYTPVARFENVRISKVDPPTRTFTPGQKTTGQWQPLHQR